MRCQLNFFLHNFTTVTDCDLIHQVACVTSMQRQGSGQSNRRTVEEKRRIWRMVCVQRNMPCCLNTTHASAISDFSVSPGISFLFIRPDSINPFCTINTDGWTTVAICESRHRRCLISHQAMMEYMADLKPAQYQAIFMKKSFVVRATPFDC